MALPADRISRVILLSFMAIILALIGAGLWLTPDVERREAELARHVMRREVDLSVQDIKWCLLTKGGDGLNLGRFHGAADQPDDLRGYNHITDIGVIIHDRAVSRVVEITTARARPLRADELEIIDYCLRPASFGPASPR